MVVPGLQARTDLLDKLLPFNSELGLRNMAVWLRWSDGWCMRLVCICLLFSSGKMQTTFMASWQKVPKFLLIIGGMVRLQGSVFVIPTILEKIEILDKSIFSGSFHDHAYDYVRNVFTSYSDAYNSYLIYRPPWPCSKSFVSKNQNHIFCKYNIYVFLCLFSWNVDSYLVGKQIKVLYRDIYYHGSLQFPVVVGSWHFYGVSISLYDTNTHPIQPLI